MSTRQVKVGLIKQGDRKKAVSQAFQLYDLPNIKNKVVLVKPNFNTADPSPGSTHNDTLISLIQEIKKRGAQKIIIGERSAPNTEEVLQAKGIREIAAREGAEVINFEALPESELIHFQRKDLHWKNGFHFPRILKKVDCIIAAACMKTHQYGGVFSMALKLAVGLVPREGTKYMEELHNSPHMRKMIAEINLAYRPDVFLIDGIEAFVDGGPAKGEKVQANVTLVGKDPVALDATGVAVLRELGSKEEIMNNPIFSHEQLVRAIELGLGVKDPAEIELISPAGESEVYNKKIRQILDSCS